MSKKINRCVGKAFERELRIGTRVEKIEHLFSIAVSRKIALDHIREFPKYYTDAKYGLITIEKKMKKS